MAKSRFSHEQILAVIQEVDAGFAPKDVSRKHGISTTTLYRWRVRFAHKKTPASVRLRSLEMENRRLKNKFAELFLDYASLRTALIHEGTKDC